MTSRTLSAFNSSYALFNLFCRDTSSIDYQLGAQKDELCFKVEDFHPILDLK